MDLTPRDPRPMVPWTDYQDNVMAMRQIDAALAAVRRVRDDLIDGGLYTFEIDQAFNRERDVLQARRREIEAAQARLMGRS
jgi:hypothetical protein